MFHCDACGPYAVKTELFREVFNLDGRRVLVKNIPANIMGRPQVSRETAEVVQQEVHGAGHLVKTVPMDLFAMN